MKPTSDRLLLDANAEKRRLSQELLNRGTLGGVENELNFLRSFSNTVRPNTAAAPRDAREAELQRILQQHSDAGQRGLRWQRGMINQQQEDFGDNLTRAMKLRDQRLQEMSFLNDLDTTERQLQQADDRIRLTEEANDDRMELADLKADASDFNSAADDAFNGIPLRSILQSYPGLTPQQQARLRLYAENYSTKNTQARETASTMADAYTALLAQARQRVAHGGTQRDKEQAIQDVMTRFQKDRGAAGNVIYDDEIRGFRPVQPAVEAPMRRVPQRGADGVYQLKDLSEEVLLPDGARIRLPDGRTGIVSRRGQPARRQSIAGRGFFGADVDATYPGPRGVGVYIR